MDEDIPEWVELKDGTRLHRTMVQQRIKALGWTREQAMREPINRAEGEDNITARACADKIPPAKVQVTMRTFNTSYEQAVAHIKELEGL